VEQVVSSRLQLFNRQPHASVLRSETLLQR
jgi:hypothetical protein